MAPLSSTGIANAGIVTLSFSQIHCEPGIESAEKDGVTDECAPALSQAAAKADVTDSSAGRMQASCFSPCAGQSQRHKILGYLSKMKTG